MKPIVILMTFAACLAFAQDSKPPELTVHTWVREDVFSGWLFNDMERFEEGARKIERILEESPEDAVAVSWRGGVELYRAVRAREAGNEVEYAKLYERSKRSFERAVQLDAKDVGVRAVTGGSYAVFGDRLSREHSADAWKSALEMYRAMYAEQSPYEKQLPVHLRGELLAGLAMSSQRVGDRENTETYLKKIVDSLPGTLYETRARKWLEQPATAGNTSLVCQTCHDAGRLENVLSAQRKP